MSRAWPFALSAAFGTSLVWYLRRRKKNARPTQTSQKMRRKVVNAIELGGTLFVPATHKSLASIANGEKYPELRSVVFDLEDGIGDEDLDTGLKNISGLLQNMSETRLLRFIRPRDPSNLALLLKMDGIEQIDGFILPKFGLANAETYLKKIGTFLFMPSIEGLELFDSTKLSLLRQILSEFQQQIILIRFGGEDMLRQLGMRRSKDAAFFDLCAPGRVIANVLLAFKPYGFQVSAPVYRFYQNVAGFEIDVQRDLTEGLMSKTIIHPSQIEPIERLYQVTEQELKEAQALTQSKKVVFAMDGGMAEVCTQMPWAIVILKRAELYGVSGNS